jgi:lipopolysaccharide biosynthesis protein
MSTTRVERWLIYATHDREGLPAGHAVAQVLMHRRLGFEAVVVDTSPHLTRQRAADWQRAATFWFQRPNRGYDFTSYRDGLRSLLVERHLRLDRLHLILANDSCYGPFNPMAGPLAAHAAAMQPRCVLGITDSWEVHYHLQSYWLSFLPDTVADAASFLEALPLLASREDAIERGELALSRYLLERGCRLDAICPIRDVAARCARGLVPGLVELGLRRLLKRPRYSHAADTVCLKYLLHRPDPFANFNPALGFGVAMVRSGSNPLIKRRLIHENPYHDRAIPADLGPARLRNEDVARLLAAH